MPGSQTGTHWAPGRSYLLNTELRGWWLVVPWPWLLVRNLIFLSLYGAGRSTRVGPRFA